MGGKNAGRSGHTWRTLKANLKRDSERAGAKCWRCGQPIDYTLDPSDMNAFSVGHILPRSTHPQAAEDPLNTLPEHRRCNLSAGNRQTRPALGQMSRDW